MKIRLPLNPYSSLALLVFLGACGSMPPAIRDFSAIDMPYQLASQNTDSYQGTPIRWGGTVIEVENETDSSLVQILYYPLDRNGFPQTNQPSEGRFAVRTSDFLDPAILAKNSKVTVIGTLAGGAERTIGNKLIHIPLILSEGIYLWPKDYDVNRTYRYGRYPYNYYPYPYFGYHPFFSRGGYYGPRWYW
ncbi:MAG: Slp family lipoprotein [Nitrosomonas sp.]|nr:Slp family lipoprotein [Nitrosomonas sp.]